MASSTISRADNSAPNPDRSLKLAMAAARIAEENRGRDIVVLDMRKVTPIFDYFVVATGGTRRQLAAISDEITTYARDTLGDDILGTEGYADGRWILLDFGNVVVHVFDAESREFYRLEQLWSQAQKVELPKSEPEPGSGESV